MCRDNSNYDKLNSCPLTIHVNTDKMINRRESDSPNSEFANHHPYTIRDLQICDDLRIVYSRLKSLMIQIFLLKFCFIFFVECDQSCFMKIAVPLKIFNVGSSLSTLLVANESLYMPTILKHDRWRRFPILTLLLTVVLG